MNAMSLQCIFKENYFLRAYHCLDNLFTCLIRVYINYIYLWLINTFSQIVFCVVLNTIFLPSAPCGYISFLLLFLCFCSRYFVSIVMIYLKVVKWFAINQCWPLFVRLKYVFWKWNMCILTLVADTPWPKPWSFT